MSNSKPQAERIVNRMYEQDAFSKWLGIEIIEIGAGVSKLQMTVREEMLNGFNVVHGGISYSLADSALAFASNSQGRLSMSIETSISHTISCKVGDIFSAIAEELSLSNKLGIYQVTVKNQREEVVALFKGTVYRTSKEWFTDI